MVEVRTHPNFNEFTLENDIALVRVNAPFDFNAGNVARITIAEPGYVPSPGELCTISGWGITALEDYEYGDAVPELRKAEIPIVGDEGKYFPPFLPSDSLTIFLPLCLYPRGFSSLLMILSS